MNIADLAGPGRTPACWEKPDLFSARALDYDPNLEEYKSLDAETKADLAAKKVEAEEAAVDVCFGCPLMLACEKIDEQKMSNPREPFIAGVIGGRTEAERRARRNGRVPAAAKSTSIPNPQIAPGDRGPRNQVDDELVARLTNAGKTSDQIARELNCSPRTVSRARKRMGLHAIKTGAAAHVANTTGTPAKVADTFSTHAAASAGETVARTEKATAAAKQSTVRTRKAAQPVTEALSSNPFIGGRPVSAAMEAVYNHLTTVGGTDSLDTLLTVGMPHVDPADALNWWTNHNSVTVNGEKVIRSSKANTPASERIREGARAKVFNSISATHRKGRYLDRDGDMFTFKAHALAAWTERMNALATTSA